jgi:hypothetical protein
MKFQVIDRQSLDLSAWENLTKNGSFFQTYHWVDICIGGLGPRACAVFLCGYENDKLSAGLPAIVISRFGAKSLYSMPYGTHGAAIFTPEISNRSKRVFLQELSDYLSSHRYSLIEIVDFDNSLIELPGKKLGRSKKSTHIIELSKDSDFHPRDKRVERHIRSGRGSGVEIVEIKDENRLDDFYLLYRLTEKRHGKRRLLYEKKFFESVIYRLKDTDMLYWTGASVEGKLIGLQINFVYGDTLTYWQGVWDYEMRQYKPGYLLMHDAVRKAKLSGAGKVNLGASPPHATGLIDYKESWGGRKVEYDILSCRSRFRKLVGRQV